MIPARQASSSPHFTLIELLVVIAIIAILASMLLPTLGRARETAQKIRCLANLKQISTSLQQYSEDYSGYQPRHWVSYGGLSYWWYQMLNPYLGKAASSGGELVSRTLNKVFECDRMPRQMNRLRGSADYTLTRYRYQGNLLYFDDSAANKYWIGFSKLSRHPSRTVQFYDGTGMTEYTYSGARYYQTSPIDFFYDYKAEDQIRADWRHGSRQYFPYTSSGATFVKGLDGQSNMSYIDGHAESVSRRSINGVSIPMHSLD